MVKSHDRRRTAISMEVELTMTRHQRRKLARKLASDHAERLAKANAAFERDLIVKRNMQHAPERNYYPQSSMSNMLGHSHRGYVCQASGSMSKRGVQSLRARGKL
jgi:hypothetical protein